MRPFYRPLLSPTQLANHQLFKALLLLLWMSLTGASGSYAQSSTAAGNALTFDGTGTYIDCGTGTRGIYTQLTIEAWVKTTSRALQLVATHAADSLGVENGFSLGTMQGHAVLYQRAAGGRLQGSGPSASVVADGRWHHLAGLVAGTQWCLYVDGVLESQGQLSPAAGTLRSSAALLLGAGRAGGQPVHVFSGEIDEVRLWNVARPEASLRASMCSGLPGLSRAGSLPELTGYFPLEGLYTDDGGSQPATLIFHGFTNGARVISGAPVGHRSLYQYGGVGPAIRLAMGGPGTDSVAATEFAAGIRGAHLYVVGAGAGRVYGVFTVGALSPVPAVPPAVFVLRYRPAAGLACHDLVRRTTCQEPWGVAGTRLSADGLALRLPVVQPRSEIQLTAAPPSYLYVTGDSLLCPGAVAALRAVAPAGARFRWNTGDTTAGIVATAPGRYTVTIASRAGCPSHHSSFELQTVPPAMPFTLGADTLLCEGTTLPLAGPSGTGLRYAWADGPTTRTRTVAAAGTYTLRVQAGCGPPQSARIRVALRDCLKVPTIITPDGDGRNDRFVIQEALPGTWQLTLYNRWGRLELHTQRYRNDWGADAAPGLYYVLLHNAGTRYTYKGWLEVRR